MKYKGVEISQDDIDAVLTQGMSIGEFGMNNPVFDSYKATIEFLNIAEGIALAKETFNLGGV